MANAGQQVARCAYPGCENEPRPGQAGTAAEPGYCGLPDPVTGEQHTALTAFRQRQVLAGQGGQAAGPEEPGRPGFAFWRRAGAQRRQRAEAAEARSAALQADARLAEALAARAAAEQEAAAAQARAAAAQRDAAERVAAAQQERDDAVAGAESRARDAEQDAARARETAQSARAELDRARVAADLQARKIREDAARAVEERVPPRERDDAVASASPGPGTPSRTRPGPARPLTGRWPKPGRTPRETRLNCGRRSRPRSQRPRRPALPSRPAPSRPRLSCSVPSPTAPRRPRRPPPHDPHARHDAAALRKLSDEQLRAPNISICTVASLPALDSIAAPNGGSVRVLLRRGGRTP